MREPQRSSGVVQGFKLLIKLVIKLSLCEHRETSELDFGLPARLFTLPFIITQLTLQLTSSSCLPLFALMAF